MNELLSTARAFAETHKSALIKAGSTLVGALLGAVVGSVVSASLEDADFETVDPMTDFPEE